MLTATGVNSPKDFPKKPEVLLPREESQEPGKAFTPAQWEAAIKHLTGGSEPRPRKKPKTDPKHGN